MLELIQNVLMIGAPDNQDPSLWAFGLAAVGAVVIMNRRQKRD